MDRARFHFFDRMRLWFNHHEPEPSASDDSSENVISLSEAFYRKSTNTESRSSVKLLLPWRTRRACSTSTCGWFGRAGP